MSRQQAREVLRTDMGDAYECAGLPNLLARDNATWAVRVASCQKTTHCSGAVLTVEQTADRPRAIDQGRGGLGEEAVGG